RGFLMVGPFIPHLTRRDQRPNDLCTPCREPMRRIPRSILRMRQPEPTATGGSHMKLSVRTALLVILGTAFVSFLMSVSFWFGIFGDPNRGLGLFVGLCV